MAIENIKILEKPIANDITETIGNTPLVKVNKLAEGIDATVLVKIEAFNPVSSVKDRVAVSLIEEAEKEGKINKDTVLIEPTSGNTGIGLAFVKAIMNNYKNEYGAINKKDGIEFYFELDMSEEEKC